MQQWKPNDQRRATCLKLGRKNTTKVEHVRLQKDSLDLHGVSLVSSSSTVKLSSKDGRHQQKSSQITYQYHIVASDREVLGRYSLSGALGARASTKLCFGCSHTHIRGIPLGICCCMVQRPWFSHQMLGWKDAGKVGACVKCVLLTYVAHEPAQVFHPCTKSDGCNLDSNTMIRNTTRPTCYSETTRH